MALAPLLGVVKGRRMVNLIIVRTVYAAVGCHNGVTATGSKRSLWRKDDDYIFGCT